MVLDITKPPRVEIEQIILFGSYSKGMWNRRSDVDLAVVCPLEGWKEIQSRIARFSSNNPDFQAKVVIGNNYGQSGKMYGLKQEGNKFHLFLIPQLAQYGELAREINKRGAKVI